MNDLQTNIASISEADIDKLFAGENIANIGADDIELGKSQVHVQDETKGDKKNPLVQEDANIPFIDFEDMDSKEKAPEDGKAEKIEEDKKPKEEPADKTKAPEVKKVEADKKKVTKTPEQEAQDQQSQEGVKEVLRNTVNYMIEKGLWRDFEDKETFLETLDENSYAELAARQYEVAIQDKVEEEMDSTGEYGRAILEYAKKGGNPDEIIDLFKEQKAVEEISITSEEGQKSLVEKYYTEVFDWSKEKVKKYINTLISSDELKTESEEVQDRYKEYYKSEVDNLKREQDVQIKQVQEQQRQFVQVINNKLKERTDFTDRDRKLIQDSVFRYDQALPDGTKVNSFYLKFAEMQKNPDEYLDLVNFVMDKKGYNEKVKKVEQKEIVDKGWKFIKGNGAVDKTQGSRHEERVINPSNQKVTEFKF